MSSRPELPSEIAELLAGADRPPPIPPEALAKLALRLERTLSIPRLDVPQRDELAEREGSASATPSAASGLRAVLRHRAALGVGMYVLGVLSAVEVQRLRAPPETSPEVAARAQHESAEVASVERPPPPVAPMPRADPASVPSIAPVASAATPHVAPSRAAKPVAAAPRSKLAEERQLLEVARAALARGRPEEALAALDEHTRRYPSGELDEEGDSLRVEALVAAGSYEQARAAAERFNGKYPSSMLRGAVTHALGSIP